MQEKDFLFYCEGDQMLYQCIPRGVQDSAGEAPGQPAPARPALWRRLDHPALEIHLTSIALILWSSF